MFLSSEICYNQRALLSWCKICNWNKWIFKIFSVKFWENMYVASLWLLPCTVALHKACLWWALAFQNTALERTACLLPTPMEDMQTHANPTGTSPGMLSWHRLESTWVWNFFSGLLVMLWDIVLSGLVREKKIGGHLPVKQSMGWCLSKLVVFVLS